MVNGILHEKEDQSDGFGQGLGDGSAKYTDAYAEWSQLPAASHPSQFARYLWLLPSALSNKAFDRAFLISLLPRYLQPGGLAPPKKGLSSTAYLDAIRGLAALAVVNRHFYWKEEFLNWPFFSLLNKGRAMVDIFFIISGFALTRRTLSLIRQDRQADVLNALGSSLFRRYIRLYLAADFAIFVTFVGAYTGLIKHYLASNKPFTAQASKFVRDILQFGNPFTSVQGYWYGGALNSWYNYYLWTIPTEFRGSLVVFGYCLACARMTPRRRILTCWFLIFLSVIWTASYAALFLFGALLAERSLADEENTPTLPLESTRHGHQGSATPSADSLRTRIVCGMWIIIGSLLLSQPENVGHGDQFPWVYLYRLIPFWWEKNELREHFWLSFGAAFIMYGIASCKLYQRPFLHPVMQYIGYLSFGIYVMQFAVMAAKPLNFIFDSMKHAFGDNYVVAAITYISRILILFWAADYFSRVDKQVVLLARRLEDRMFSKKG